MDKSSLEKYADLLQEIDEIEARIYRLKSQIDKIDKQLLDLSDEEVEDCVSGGEGGKQHFHISGFPSREYRERYTLLQSKQNRLRLEQAEWLDRKIKCELMLKEVKDFMKKLSDSSKTNQTDNHYYKILNLRFYDKKSWEEIARIEGGGNTGDGIRIGTMRFLQSKGVKK